MSTEITAIDYLRRITSESDVMAREELLLEAKSWLAELPADEPELEVPFENTPAPKLRKNRHGFYCVPVMTPGGRQKLVTTGLRDRQEAMRVVRASGVDRLVLMARAGVLTAESVVMATAGRRLTCEALLEPWSTEVGISASESTARHYRVHVEELFKFAGCWNRPIGAITREQLSDFVNRSGKLSTRQLRKSSIKSLYRFAQGRGYTIGNPMDSVVIHHQQMTHEQKEKRSVIPFTEAEYRRVLAAPLSRFWRAAVTISWWTGLRLSDVSMLTPDQITDTHLICWTIKRRHRLELPFSNPLVGSPELINCLRDVKANPWLPDQCFQEASHLQVDGSTDRLGNQFVRMLRPLSIEFKSFHSLRHSAISRFHAAGMTIEAIGGLVGHRNRGTTQGYIHNL